MPATANPLNYQIGKGTIVFTPTGGAAQDLGNAPEVEITPTVDKLAHYSSRAGIQSKDREVVRRQEFACRVVLDEIIAENLQLLLLGGAISPSTAGNDSFVMGANTQITGALVFTGTNEVGNKVIVTMPSVSFGPSGSLQLISDEWNQIEITAEVLYDETIQGFGTVEIEEVAVPT